MIVRPQMASEWRFALGAGLAIAAVYTLSPLTVWFVLAMIGVVGWARRGLDGDERRWVTVILVAGIVARAAAVLALFALTDHNKVPFGSFFGDEEYFIRRSIWLRNTGLGLPMHGADLIYAFDEYSATSYLYVLAFLQLLVGAAPYGVHLLGIAFYVASTVVLYRIVRPAFGAAPALAGLTVLLFLPTLFAWSISALKDPLFSLLAALSLGAALKVVRARSWRSRLAAVAVLVVLAVVLGTIRQAGGMIVVASVVTGLATALFVPRPRLLIATVVALPIVTGLALKRPEVQVQAFKAVAAAAGQHWGHVATPGWSYKVLDDRFYPDRGSLMDMHFDETLRFVIRALERYATVPLPWESQSTAALAYLPEQLVWYCLLVLTIVGLPLAFRRNVLIAGLMAGYAIVPALLVAFTSGNVGTLVRHRSLSLPYLVWLSTTAFCELVALTRPTRPARPPGPLWR